MHQYRFKNLNVKHNGSDYLCNGLANYVIEDYEEDGKQAGFESAEIYDAVGKEGFIISQEVLKDMTDSVIATLNNDNYLCRILGGKL